MFATCINCPCSLDVGLHSLSPGPSPDSVFADRFVVDVKADAGPVGDEEVTILHLKEHILVHEG